MVNLFSERECVYEVSDGTRAYFCTIPKILIDQSLCVENSLLCNECVDSEMQLEKSSNRGVTGEDNEVGEVHEYCQDAEDSDSDDLHWDFDNDNDELILPVSSSSRPYFNDIKILTVHLSYSCTSYHSFEKVCWNICKFRCITPNAGRKAFTLGVQVRSSPRGIRFVEKVSC